MTATGSPRHEGRSAGLAGIGLFLGELLDPKLLDSPFPPLYRFIFAMNVTNMCGADTAPTRAVCQKRPTGRDRAYLGAPNG